MSDWDTELLDLVGAKPTQANRRFLRSWQRWEGGHTHNAAKYNWLNTTIDSPGAVSSINSVGVKAFKDRRSGLNALAATLLNGRYNDIVKALRAGDPYRHDVSAGLQTWVSGRPDGNPEYAQKVLGTAVPKAALPRGGRGPRGNSGLAAVPDGPNLEPLKIAFSDDPEFVQVLKSLEPKVLERAKIVSPRGTLKDPETIQHSPVTKIAASQIGKPYVFGSGPDTSSFDCSDLIQWAYGQVGIELPRTTFDQIKVGRNVKGQTLKPGDLVFPTTHHVVMYVGNGKVIAAPHTGTVVQYQPLSRFRNPVAVRRIL